MTTSASVAPTGTDPAAPVDIAFIIPVRHPENAPDWDALVARLSSTMASIAAQQHPGWRAVVAVDRNARLPALPPGVHAVRTDIPPNPRFTPEGQTRSDFHDAVRLDKGRRVLAALLASGPARHIMVVDDDDFVSNRLAQHVASGSADACWRVDQGHVWTPGTRLLYTHPDFSSLCGTSVIIPRTAYGVPPSMDEADPNYVKDMLGSHVRVKARVAEQGLVFGTVPFPAAVYRAGHAGAHSRSKSVLRTYLLNKAVLTAPARIAASLPRFTRYGAAERAEFGLP